MKDYSLQIVYDRQYNNLKARKTFRGVKTFVRAKEIVAKQNNVRSAHWFATRYIDPVVIK